MEPHLPGTAKVVSTGSNSYRVSMKIRMGFLRPTVNAYVELSNIDESRSFTIELSGKSMGAGVSGKADVTLTSTGHNSGSTTVEMAGSVETSGMLKKVADSKIKAAAIGFLESYFTSVEGADSSN
jgi:carbon monoxide dehydrogenase subunit G